MPRDRGSKSGSARTRKTEEARARTREICFPAEERAPFDRGKDEGMLVDRSDLHESPDSIRVDAAV